MARYGKETKLAPEKVLSKAVEFFKQTGLNLKQQDDCSASFEGGGGHVIITAEPKGSGADVDLETREWDYQVKEFMKKL
ncbi:MAG: hypothetical protein EHM45_01345 [Desulfobacteraceae bacterium]|nr:MAG: hypothetical protein EHM45_01345 [Desulfobacteraceae bacterium]